MFCYLLTFLNLIILIQNTEGWKPRHFPKIGISEFAMNDEEDHHLWETDIEKMPEGAVTITDNGQTYIISQPILALTIDCNASYPVQWNFLNAEDAAESVYSVRIRMFRYAKDVYNPSTNSYTSQLQLYGDTNAITGEYECFSTEYEDVKKKIYIYWQGGSPSPLIPQERTEDACLRPDNTAVLPCRVAEPNARPNLYFEIKCNEKYKAIDGPFFKYDPKIGFTMDMSQFGLAFGRYKCAMDEDDSFGGFFNLKNESCLPRIFNNTMVGSASFKYSKKDQRVICCSNSTRPPSIQGNFNKKLFPPFEIPRKRTKVLNWPLIMKTGNNGVVFKNGSCVYEKIYERDSGMIRCKGDGIDVMRPFYTELQPNKNESFNLYFDWNALQPEKLIAMTINSRRPIYDKQNITINCETSYFYFSEGVKWAKRWKNGSLEFLNLDTGTNDQDRTSSTYQTIRIPAHLNITEVLCFAPVWNSSEWVNKTYKLEVKESFPPQFKNKDIEVVNLMLNDTEQVMVCKASGTPLPVLRWRKNNRTVLNENNVALKRKNASMYLTIHRVSHESQGEYKCLASNFAGKTEKIYQVYVIDPGQPLSASAIAFVTLLVFVVFGGVGFLLWRMQLQRQIINHLTGIVFRDVGTSNGTGNNATARNQSISNTRAHVSATNGGMEFSVPAQESNHI